MRPGGYYGSTYARNLEIPSKYYSGFDRAFNWKKGLGIGMLIGGIGLDIFGEMEQRRDLAEDLEFEAQARRKASGNIAAMTQETLHDTLVAEQYAIGAARAEQASAGAAVGTGSNIYQVASVAAEFRRKRELIAKKAGLERSTLETEAGELEQRAKKMKKPDWWSIGSSILQGGFQLATGMGWLA